MAAIGGGLFVIVVLTGIFLAPFVLGAYVVVGSEQRPVLTTYFGVITAAFVLMVVLGLLATLALIAA